MSFVSDSLVSGEKIEYQTTVSYWSYIINILIALGLTGAAWYFYMQATVPVLIPALLTGATLVLALLTNVLRNANELAATNERVIIKIGWLFQKSAVLYLARVEGVEIYQSLLGRLLGYGTVQVRGVGTEVFPVPYVISPKTFRREVFQAAGKSA